MKTQKVLQDNEGTQKLKNNRGNSMALLLFISNLVLLYFLLNMQISRDYARGRFAAALNTISEKNDEIASLADDIDIANSRITSLKSDNEELESEIDSLNTKISSLSTPKISRIDINNKHCTNSYIFVDGRLAAGTRAGGTTYFYLPHGSYSFQICNEPSRSNCGSSVPVNAGVSVFTFTVNRHPSCP